ncbi:MAG: AAA family ATPase [Phycisphaerales bacterium]|nr:AAA family ATPase [Phycisphaerales bacterium]MCB9836004.1 AAA family ATPase [Phycisphaera sp.]
MGNLTDIERLEGLISAGRPLVTIQTYEEDQALDVVRQVALGERGLAVWTVLSGVYDGLIDRPVPVDNTTNPAAALYHLGYQNQSSIVCLIDMAAHLDEPAAVRGLRDLVAAMERRGGTVVMIDHAEKLPGVVTAHASRLDLSLPGEEELEQIVKETVRRLHVMRAFEIDLTKKQLNAIIANLRGLTRRQAAQVVADIVRDDDKLNERDIDRVVQLKREMVQSDGMLEFTAAPASLDEIGGMDRLKRWLRVREHALESSGDQPRGVLLLGVQGGGKSLCAKAIATAWKRPLLRMDVGALYDKYIGESEHRLRQTLRQAELMAPIVLWIDEIEKAFAGSASQATDGGLSRRMFGALLTWMQEHREPVFVVATANDIEALPPELLRKGRFDEIFFVDLPSERARRAIFEIHLRRRGMDPAAFDLDELVEASDGFSGAEIEQAVISAGHEAGASGRQVDTGSLVKQIAESPPLSVTMAERMMALRAWASGRCVPAE